MSASTQRRLLTSTACAVEKLAQDVCTLWDAPELFTSDLESFGDRAEFLLAYSFYSFGKQPNVRHSLLSRVVPNYTEKTRELNDLVQSGRKKNAASAAPQCAYRRLERLMSSLRRANVRGVFVAMPTAADQTLDPMLAETVRESGMTFIDGRRIGRLGAERFIDALHMDPAGADTYSRFVADAIAEQLKELIVARHLAGGQPGRIDSVESGVNTRTIKVHPTSSNPSGRSTDDKTQ